MASADIDMFRPPIARGMKVLDRSFFEKTVPLKALRIFDNKNISKVRSQLGKDVLVQERLANVYSDPDPERARSGKKCILLRPDIQGGENGVSDNLSTKKDPPASPVLRALLDQQLVSLIPYQLHLDYTYWTYHDVISSILPLEAQDEIPSGFAQVGHVAHLNLREEYLPYKHLIAEILMDKNPSVRTVINKIDDVGQENEFRTFRYEVLAGPDDMNVTVSEANCTFSFDYSKVYWNSRLQTEHSRLVASFTEGEVVCDVMAGIGPFAVPAGKKGVFVWANDLNPDSHAGLVKAIAKNKVGEYVKAFHADGREFIRSASSQLLADEHKVEIRGKASRTEGKQKPVVLKTLVQPKTFQHFVLNLPASALTFLPSFIGLYPPGLRERIPVGTEMPIIHVYCFSVKDELVLSESLKEEGTADEAIGSQSGAIESICAEISQQLKFEMKPGSIEDKGGVAVYDVRDVAPKKRMFCASFRLPEEVAFRAE
ncbi:Met-10+ like-protein-domain-containing protein [Neohortaea acidophila]|uniref:tRNA (guanine(37)-N1)-methyltransferase n=1 Tax=Neohortaea acidophila TaxID=245834 RepID=A0A6A6PQB2_9PEZI|nr:Met-10+ like-protein-domain-containing protein [Neohortaea acidophila]KAF2481427.1 Met-10+ like-protein-domain-containing protein [Neohortaea acidophila]